MRCGCHPAPTDPLNVFPICEESCRQPNDIYKIKGDGTFGSPSAVNLPNGFLGLVIADINGDGIPDLVNDYVEVALGKGGGKFRAPVYYPVDAPRDFGLNAFAQCAMVGLPLENLSLQRMPSIRVFGKGRKERCLPLWKETTADLRAWLAVRGVVSVPELFVNADGAAMTRAGFEYILNKHVRSAAKTCSSMEGRSVSPHQLRHSCALIMLQATRDIRRVALWLGHADVRTTEIYLRADISDKLEAVEHVLPLGLRRGRFKPPDALITSLFDPG